MENMDLKNKMYFTISERLKDIVEFMFEHLNNFQGRSEQFIVINLLMALIKAFPALNSGIWSEYVLKLPSSILVQT